MPIYQILPVYLPTLSACLHGHFPISLHVPPFRLSTVRRHSFPVAAWHRFTGIRCHLTFSYHPLYLFSVSGSIHFFYANPFPYILLWHFVFTIHTVVDSIIVFYLSHLKNYNWQFSSCTSLGISSCSRHRINSIIALTSTMTWPNPFFIHHWTSVGRTGNQSLYAGSWTPVHYC